MTGEITITDRLEVNHADGVPHADNSQPIQVDQTNAGGPNPGTVSITTSDTAIDFGDLTTPGWVKLVNLDTTNTVNVGPDSGGAIVPFLTLKADQSPQRVFLNASVVMRARLLVGRVLFRFWGLRLSLCNPHRLSECHQTLGSDPSRDNGCCLSL